MLVACYARCIAWLNPSRSYIIQDLIVYGYSIVCQRIMLAIDIQNVSKSFDQFAVLTDFNLSVTTGQVYGLLGPNAAGKSTLMHMMLGFLSPNKGTIRLLGSNDLEQVRSRIGYLPERLQYHLRYTGREYLRYLGQFNDMRGSRLAARIEDELRAVDLLSAADRLLSTYSKGMLQRLGIAQSLLTDPEMLLIDEPTSGLDPAGQRELLELLGHLRSRGHTIFLATHYLDEIEYLCDHVGILFDGKLATEVDVAALRVPGGSVTLTVGSMTPEIILRLQRLSPAIRCNGYDIVIQPNTIILQEQVLRTLLDEHIPIIALEPQNRPLEELYMRVVRRETLHADKLLFEPKTRSLPDSAAEPMYTTEVAKETKVTGEFDTTQIATTTLLPGRPKRGETLLRDLLRKEERNNDSRQDQEQP